MKNKKVFFFLWIASILGCGAVLPYVLFIGSEKSGAEFGKVLVSNILIVASFYAVVCFLSAIILPKTDLEPFRCQPFWQRVLCPGLIWGTTLGIVLHVLAGSLFGHSLFSDMHLPRWIGLLASVYGAVNEEVLLRLLLFTLVYFILCKCCKNHAKQRTVLLWSTNVFIALVFGLGHLPMAFQLMPVSVYEIFRILFLNGLAGVVFGWLYWSKGFWTGHSSPFYGRSNVVCDLGMNI